MKTLYILAGPNGAGKTTAAYTFLPDLLDCRVYINADEIARGLSPFDVEAVAFEAGRIMLQQIEKNLEEGNTFSIETTLATRYYIQLVKRAINKNYKIVILFLYLDSYKTAQARVKSRVQAGGHNIPEDVIKRRFERGLYNFFNYFKDLAHEWYFIDNEKDTKIIARKTNTFTETDNEIFRTLAVKYEQG